jgi:F-type H+-transporting ATPase subunit b
MLDFSVTFFITIINIVFLCFILRAILFKPVTKFMADRARRVKENIDNADKDRAAAKKLLVQYEIQLRKAQDEADDIIRTARKNAKQEAERYIEEGKAEAAAIIASTRAQLELEKKAAMTKFMTDAAGIITLASARLVSREFNSEDNERYAKMLINELAAQKGTN